MKFFAVFFLILSIHYFALSISGVNPAGPGEPNQFSAAMVALSFFCTVISLTIIGVAIINHGEEVEEHESKRASNSYIKGGRLEGAIANRSNQGSPEDSYDYSGQTTNV